MNSLTVFSLKGGCRKLPISFSPCHSEIRRPPTVPELSSAQWRIRCTSPKLCREQVIQPPKPLSNPPSKRFEPGIFPFSLGTIEHHRGILTLVDLRNLDDEYFFLPRGRVCSRSGNPSIGCTTGLRGAGSSSQSASSSPTQRRIQTVAFQGSSTNLDRSASASGYRSSTSARSTIILAYALRWRIRTLIFW